MPKAFHEIARWDGGLNTHFDESDIEGTELSDVSLWSVSKPGQIYTISNYVATGTPPQSGIYSTNVFSVASDATPLVRYGFIIAESDYAIGTNEVAAVVETRYAFIIDSKGELTVLEAFSSSLTTEINLDSASGLDTAAPKPRMFWSEGALRISDSIHGANSKVKWWGVVSFQRFTNSDDVWLNPMGASAGNADSRWVWADASQPKPAVIGTATNTNAYKDNFGAVIYGSTALNYPSQVPGTTMGKGINMNISASTSATDGGWEATSYEFGQTLVYVGNQESMIAPMRIYNSGDTADVSIASQQYWTSVQVFASTSATYDYDKRVTGARIYIRKVGQNKRWTLFLDADFERGVRRNTFDSFDTIWVRGGVGTYSSSVGLKIKSPSPQTYESLNGYSPNESVCSFENDTHGWEDSTVLNRRTFLIGVKYLNDYSGQSEVMPDRIYYSAMAKYDTYPTTNWIDIGVNDGESFTAIEGFANRILAFKQGTLYIINVQNPNDGGWFLEAELKGMGITSADAVTKSDQGILFANTTGLFRFAGDGIPKRLTDKLNKTDWTTDLSTASHFIQVGYDGASEQCFVGEVGIVAAGLHTASSPVYIYDFRTGSFVKHTNYLTDGRSNFSNIPDTRELLWIEPDTTGGTGDEDFKISKYVANTLGAEESAAAGDQYFITKLDDLGSPALMKKFYNLYINLKTGGNYDFDVIVNGGAAVNMNDSTLGSFTKLKVSLSTVANASTFQLKILNKTTTSITINSISLEYRVLYKRVS